MILEEGKLPRKIAEEILTKELKLKKELHGEYRMHEFEPEFDHNNPTDMRIDWSRGSWTFTPSYQPPIKIGPGITSHFGMAGGDLIILPWGTVVINDYKINLVEKGWIIIFYGTCWSVWSKVQLSFHWRLIAVINEVMMETKEDVVEQKKIRLFRK